MVGGKLCSCQCILTLGLLGAIVAQVSIALFVMKATKVMKEEWPRKVKANGEKVLVAHLPMFWGPVHVLIPTNCAEATHWDKELKEELLHLATGCHTSGDEGVGANFMCAFPAKYNGVTYDGCLTVDEPSGRPWCFTEVDADGVGDDSFWGICEPTCAIAITTTQPVKTEVRRVDLDGGEGSEEAAEENEKTKTEKQAASKKKVATKEPIATTTPHPVGYQKKKEAEYQHVYDKDMSAYDELREEDKKEAHKKEEEEKEEAQKKKEEDAKVKAEEEKQHAAIAKLEDLEKEKEDADVEEDGEIVQRQLRRLSDDRELFGTHKMIIPRHIRNITVCKGGRAISRDFDGPSYWHRYFAMISLSSMITGGTTSMSKLHESRLFSYHFIFVGLMVTMALKYSLKLVDVCSNCWGHKYVQLWNGGRTTIDKMLESLMIQGVSIIFTLAMQLTLCTLFLTFWQGEYFVMSYVPGLGFCLFFMSFVFFSILMTYDRIKQVMLHAGDRYIYCFWFMWAFWMLMIAVPMMGYSVYVMQFVFEVKREWLNKEPFSDAFINASRTVCNAAGAFTGVAIFELGIILTLDMQGGKMRHDG